MFSSRLFLRCCALIFISIASVCISDALAGTSFSGKVTDRTTGETLPGVIVYFPDLKVGTITNDSGSFAFENLPQTAVVIQISYVGYKQIVETIDLSFIQHKIFAMEESPAELNEVVVTGLSKASELHRTPSPISTVSQQQLNQIAASNIVDAIAMQPGVSQVTSGVGISKPMIRGLGFNRIVTVNDGIRQEGQQWGDEHGIELDEFGVTKVEILKGPASLAYGSDAMAGVIHFISAPSLEDGKITAGWLTEYQSNNGLMAYSANFTGNKNGIVWDARYSSKKAHAYRNVTDGFVFNSGFHESSIKGMIGLNKPWGYSHVHVSKYEINPGIITGSRDSISGKFTKEVAQGDSIVVSQFAEENDYMSYKNQSPFQKVNHTMVLWNSNFLFAKGSIKAILGYQENQRREFDDPLHLDVPGLNLKLRTINYDVRYVFPDKKNLSIAIGCNGMKQGSENAGIEFLIPDYSLTDVGLFGMFKKTKDKLDLSGGLRGDMRFESGEELMLDSLGSRIEMIQTGSVIKFSDFDKQFTGLTGSIGAAYQWSTHFFTKINVSRGFRTPNISELASNGIHEGTSNYILGNTALKPEQSWQGDAALGIITDHITAELNGFTNFISNFIFLEKIPSVFGGDSLTENYSAYRYVAGDANLTGGEITTDLHPHPLDWLHFENTFSFVVGKLSGMPDSAKYLPFMPPPKITSELKAERNSKGKIFANSYIKIGLEFVCAQHQFYSANRSETYTPAYQLFQAGIGTDLMFKKERLLSIYITCNNIFDVSYQSL